MFKKLIVNVFLLISIFYTITTVFAAVDDAIYRSTDGGVTRHALYVRSLKYDASELFDDPTKCFSCLASTPGGSGLILKVFVAGNNGAGEFIKQSRFITHPAAGVFNKDTTTIEDANPVIMWSSERSPAGLFHASIKHEIKNGSGDVIDSIDYRKKKCLATDGVTHAEADGFLKDFDNFDKLKDFFIALKGSITEIKLFGLEFFSFKDSCDSCLGKLRDKLTLGNLKPADDDFNLSKYITLFQSKTRYNPGYDYVYGTSIYFSKLFKFAHGSVPSILGGGDEDEPEIITPGDRTITEADVMLFYLKAPLKKYKLTISDE